MIFDIATLNVVERQQLLQSAIAPRPIALASTVNKYGVVNIAPFSFFNVFSAEPPIVIFSVARRVRNNTTKHTLENIYDVPEVVIHVCDYAMVQQVNIASAEYPEGVNECDKAGFTTAASSMIRPPRINEAKIALECKVKEIKPLGRSGGSGNLIIAKVLCMHVNEEVMNSERTMIDPLKFEHVARIGGDEYVRVNRHNVFSIQKPSKDLPIGFDGIPEHIRSSKVLTGNQLGLLANCPRVPERDDTFTGVCSHERAALLLDLGLIEEAWQTLLHWENPPLIAL